METLAEKLNGVVDGAGSIRLSMSVNRVDLLLSDSKTEDTLRVKAETILSLARAIVARADETEWKP